MSAYTLLLQLVNGLAGASALFLLSCGLTLIFGVTRIVNFAHGSLYMVGAFTAATLVPWMLDMWFGPASFWAGILISAIIVGIIGVIIEVLLLRRIYGAPELFQLLATFGVVLVVQDDRVLAAVPATGGRGATAAVTDLDKPTAWDLVAGFGGS